MSEQYRLIADATSADVESLRGYEPFAVARAADASARRFFIRGAATPGAEVSLPASECLPFPKDMDASRAILALPVASVLALWDIVSLELGEVAVWTAGSPLSALTGRAALWRGARSAIELGPSPSPDRAAGQEFVDWSDAEAATTRLGGLITGCPGFVAVDLSGRAAVIDILLESIPTFGRLLLAGPVGDSLTIDYYKNVHRKGIVMATTVLEPTHAFDPIAGVIVRGQLSRAFELLRNPVTATQCRDLLMPASSEVVAR